jgi:hypothetical protein
VNKEHLQCSLCRAEFEKPANFINKEHGLLLDRAEKIAQLAREVSDCYEKICEYDTLNDITRSFIKDALKSKRMNKQTKKFVDNYVELIRTYYQDDVEDTPPS